MVFTAFDAVTLTLVGRKHSLLTDVKEFSTIIICLDLIISALPVLLSKAADAITILDLEQ